MAHSPRYEARLEAAWRDLLASLDVLCAELKTAPPALLRDDDGPASDRP